MRLNPLLDALGTYPQIALEARKAEVVASGRTLFDFSVGDPIEQTPPFIREAVRAAVPDVSQYPSIRGTSPLRQSIAHYLDRRFGVALDPERQIIPTSGSKEAVFHMPLLVIEPGVHDRCVVYPDPGYPAYERGARFAGGEAVAQPLTGDFLQRPWELPDELLARTRLMWINSPQNPTGAVMPLAHLERIHRLCRAHDILLVNDECYADVYTGAAPHSLLQAGLEGVVVLHSLSKRSGMTGYRSGFMAGDPEVIAALCTLRANPGLAPLDLVNAGATRAWADDAHAADRREVFRERRAVVEAFLSGEGLQLAGSEATFYLWVRCPPSHDDEAYAMALLDHGIVVSPGRMFGRTGAGAGYVRVALVPPLEVCIEAVQVWRRAHRALGIAGP